MSHGSIRPAAPFAPACAPAEANVAVRTVAAAAAAASPILGNDVISPHPARPLFMITGLFPSHRRTDSRDHGSTPIGLRRNDRVSGFFRRREQRDAVGLVLVRLPPGSDPSTSRPPLTWSRVAAMFATTAGCR